MHEKRVRKSVERAQHRRAHQSTRIAHRGGATYGGMASEPLVGPPNWNEGVSTMFDVARVV